MSVTQVLKDLHDAWSIADIGLPVLVLRSQSDLVALDRAIEAESGFSPIKFAIEHGEPTPKYEGIALEVRT